jgi:WD40 repeat protein
MSTSADKSLRLWSVASGELIETYIGHEASVNSVAFAPDGRSFVSASNDGTLRLWNTTYGKPIREFVGHSDRVNAVSFSPDGRLIASGSDDYSIRLWDPESTKSRMIIHSLPEENWISETEDSHYRASTAARSYLALINGLLVAEFGPYEKEFSLTK